MDGALRLPADPGKSTEPDWAGPLARAAEKIARLDQATGESPLLPALLYRARLAAVRRQAAADSFSVDPWHLAAVLEGLRLRMDPFLRIADRGAIFAAARHALALHQWLVAPDFDQEGAIRDASRALAAAATGKQTPLLAAAQFLHAWLHDGGARAPARAALIRFWVAKKILRAPLPLTAPAALRPGTPWEQEVWIPVFLAALADEAEDCLELLRAMERAWLAARRAVAGRRKNSRAALAVDLLAAAPLVSPRSLAAGLGMAVGNTTKLLDDFCAAGIAVEVSHRGKRRLFGLAGLAPLREHVAPPRRPEPGRGRGRPPLTRDEMETPIPPLPERPMTPLEWRELDYSDLTHFMAQADAAIRNTRRVLAGMAAASPMSGEDQADAPALADSAPGDVD